MDGLENGWTEKPIKYWFILVNNWNMNTSKFNLTPWRSERTPAIGKHSVKDGGLRFQYIQLMKTLIKHILQNFASNSYMERHAFVYELEFEDSIYGKSNFKPLIKESYTFNQHQEDLNLWSGILPSDTPRELLHSMVSSTGENMILQGFPTHQIF